MLLADDRLPWLGALVLGGLLILAGGLVALFSYRLGSGKVDRNHVMGLRIRSTMESDEAWEAGQKAFAPWGIAAGLGAVVGGLALFSRPTPGWGNVIVLFASCWLVVLPGLGTFLGDQAAKQAVER